MEHMTKYYWCMLGARAAAAPEHGSSGEPCWEELAFPRDAAEHHGSCVWPPRFYACSFCRREFRSAQALGGHMNVHRRDLARLRQCGSGSPPDHDVVVQDAQQQQPIAAPPVHHHQDQQEFIRAKAEDKTKVVISIPAATTRRKEDEEEEAMAERRKRRRVD